MIRKEIAPGIFMTIKQPQVASLCLCQSGQALICEGCADHELCVCLICKPSTSVAAKVAYVVRQPQSRYHRCHFPECEMQVPPAMFMCAVHWRQIPRNLQRKVWHAYEIGQEVNMTPSTEYLAVVDEVQKYIEEHLL